jgi:hypothetical protein
MGGGEGGIRPPSRYALRRDLILSSEPSRRSSRRIHARAKEDGGEGGIRTPVPVTRQDAFEAPPLRPLRYLSNINFARWGPFNIPHIAARSGRRCATVPSGPRPSTLLRTTLSLSKGRLRPQALASLRSVGPLYVPHLLAAARAIICELRLASAARPALRCIRAIRSSSTRDPGSS